MRVQYTEYALEIPVERLAEEAALHEDLGAMLLRTPPQGRSDYNRKQAQGYYEHTTQALRRRMREEGVTS